MAAANYSDTWFEAQIKMRLYAYGLKVVWNNSLGYNIDSLCFFSDWNWVFRISWKAFVINFVLVCSVSGTSSWPTSINSHSVYKVNFAFIFLNKSVFKSEFQCTSRSIFFSSGTCCCLTADSTVTIIKFNFARCKDRGSRNLSFTSLTNSLILSIHISCYCINWISFHFFIC